MMKKPVKKYAMGGAVTTTSTNTTKKPVMKKTVKKVVKKPNYPVDDYKDMVDPMTGKKGTMGGTGTTPPFGGPKLKKGTKVFNGVTGRYDTVKKNGGSMRKAKSGTSLGMKSVKSGYDNNSGVTRADFVAIGKGTAKSGTKMKMGGKTPKKVMGYGGKAASMAPMKSGGKMAKCKYGCK